MNSFTDLFLYLPSLYRLLFLLHYVFADETVHLYHFGFYRLRYFSCWVLKRLFVSLKLSLKSHIKQHITTQQGSWCIYILVSVQPKHCSDKSWSTTRRDIGWISNKNILTQNMYASLKTKYLSNISI